MIEFLFWEGCPSHERALERLRGAMAEYAVEDRELQVTEVLTDADAARLGFPGSPTIRFDGVDLQDPSDQPSALTCRLYRLRDGRPSPLPDPDDLRDSLRNYAARHVTQDTGG
ncbi:MAG TPA: hypothetical protein VGO97_02495 [Solirubrobacterales bacterium]|nr:hypothetical protein [Solirubrobacterales bacterium]